MLLHSKGKKGEKGRREGGSHGPYSLLFFVVVVERKVPWVGSERKAINREKGKLSFTWKVGPGRLLSGRSWRHGGPREGPCGGSTVWEARIGKN